MTQSVALQSKKDVKRTLNETNARQEDVSRRLSVETRRQDKTRRPIGTKEGGAREREEERVEKEEVAGEHSTAPGVNEGSAHPERNRSHAARIRLKHTELSRRSSNRVSTSVHSSLSNYSLKQDCRCGNTI